MKLQAKTQLSMRRAEKRSWFYHQKIAREINQENWKVYKAKALLNISFLLKENKQQKVRLLRWQEMIEKNKLTDLRKIMLSVDEEAVLMRQVSPMEDVNGRPFDAKD